MSLSTVIVASIGVNVEIHSFTVSTASNIASLSSCISLLYASGSPFIIVRSVCRSPYTLAVLPLISSVTSGFFFCGIIELPVEYASSSSINLNSHEHHMIISSENLERCIISIEISEHNSTQKSLSDTPSRLFIVISLKPRSSAVLFLLRGYVVPASAHEPSGITSILSLQSASLVRSLVSICAYAIR